MTNVWTDLLSGSRVHSVSAGPFTTLMLLTPQNSGSSPAQSPLWCSWADHSHAAQTSLVVFSWGHLSGGHCYWMQKDSSFHPHPPLLLPPLPLQHPLLKLKNGSDKNI